MGPSLFYIPQQSEISVEQVFEIKVLQQSEISVEQVCEIKVLFSTKVSGTTDKRKLPAGFSGRSLFSSSDKVSRNSSSLHALAIAVLDNIFSSPINFSSKTPFGSTHSAGE